MRSVALLTSSLRRALAAAWKGTGVDRNDARVVLGLALLGAGIGSHDIGLALIVLGCLVLLLGIYGSMFGGRQG